METKSLSRAQGSRLARVARDPGNGLGLDAEHGSGTAPVFRRAIHSETVSVGNWREYVELFDEIFYVRDAFAHSFIDIENVKYRHVRLVDCFGNLYLGVSMRDAENHGARIFMEDVAALFAPIIRVFETIQLKQIDEKKFAKLCDRLMMSRSLAPGP